VTPSVYAKESNEFLERVVLRAIFIMLIFAYISLLFPAAHAQPITAAPSTITSNGAFLSATGGTPSGTGWFTYGTIPGDEYWITQNITEDSSGNFNYTVWGSPMTGATVWYAKACDAVSGCGNEVTFTTLPVTPMPIPSIGAMYQNITASGFNPLAIGQNLLTPLMWNGEPLTVIFMLLISPIFLGIWLRSKTVLVVLVTGMIGGGFFLYANYGMNWGMPPEVVGLTQGMVYIAFAGCVLYILHR